MATEFLSWTAPSKSALLDGHMYIKQYIVFIKHRPIFLQTLEYEQKDAEQRELYMMDCITMCFYEKGSDNISCWLVCLFFNQIIKGLVTHPNPVRHLRSFSEQKLRYIWWNPRAFWPCIDRNGTETFKAQKGRILLKLSMWHQWFNRNVMKLCEYFLCAKKTKTMTLFNTFFSLVVLLWMYNTNTMLAVMLAQHDRNQPQHD